MIRDYLILLSWLCAVQGKTGYFWHITDIHYDPKYSTQGSTTSMCWNTRNSLDSGRLRLDRKLAGEFGDYSCDSPWALIESAARAMKSMHGEGIEFVLWTGDALTRSAGMSVELRLQCLRNLTDLLHRTFKGQFVFPALGHEDIGVNYTQLATLWQHWLPPEAVDTFVKAGYYTIEQRSKKYRIVFLNTNLWLNPVDNRMLHRVGSSTVDNTMDPFGQWSWFQSVLENARKKKETREKKFWRLLVSSSLPKIVELRGMFYRVNKHWAQVYIVGHTPPGVDDHEIGAATLHERHNIKYLQIVRLYSDIIRGQFFGHWHSDTFRVIYNDMGQPVSWIMMAPSVTPSAVGGPNNPGLRLYKFETNTGQILDYTQYYLNLPEANSNGKANWMIEYSLLEYYDLQEISAITLHDLADRFTQSNDNAFVRYYGANTVTLPREVEQIWGCGGPLNGVCALHHYCTVTRLNPNSYKECYSSYAYALASTAHSTVRPYFALHLLSMLICAEILNDR